MTESEALSKLTPPGKRRPHIGWGNGGVLQIHVTRACDKACFGCTQGSQLAGRTEFMSPEHFEQAVQSLGFIDGDGICDVVEGAYFGVVGVFGGNGALSPHFHAYCDTLRRYVPFRQRGLWCNHPRGKGAEMRRTFNPTWSNLNTHMDQAAYDEFRATWPECNIVNNNNEDSRHAPPFVAMKDLDRLPIFEGERLIGEMENTEANRWQVIAGCDISRSWSALIGVFRGQLRAWFCELAGAQSMLHQDEPDYPDTGLDPTFKYTANPPVWWWQLPMEAFAHQAAKHCHECGMPLRGYGALACDESGSEQVSETHALIFRPKRTKRKVEMVTGLEQLNVGRLKDTTKYVANARA